MIMPVLQKQLQSVLQLITCLVSEWMAWMSLKFIKRARSCRTSKNGEGPTLIECDTYRKYGHFEGDEQKLNHQMIVMQIRMQRKTLNVKHLKKVG